MRVELPTRARCSGLEPYTREARTSPASSRPTTAASRRCIRAWRGAAAPGRHRTDLLPLERGRRAGDAEDNRDSFKASVCPVRRDARISHVGASAGCPSDAPHRHSSRAVQPDTPVPRLSPTPRARPARAASRAGGPEQQPQPQEQRQRRQPRPEGGRRTQGWQEVKLDGPGHMTSEPGLVLTHRAC